MPFPEVWMYGEELGEFLYDAAQAYLLTWTFYVVTVVRPRNDEEELILAMIYADLQWIAGSAHLILQEFGRAANSPVPEKPTDDEVKNLCAAVNTSTPPNMMVPGGGIPASFARQATWQEYLAALGADVEIRQNRIRPHYTRLPPELVTHLHGIDSAHWLRALPTLTRTAWKNENLGFLGTMMVDYLGRCHALAEYLRLDVDPALGP